jgi:hypothetical protein
VSGGGILEKRPQTNWDFSPNGQPEGMQTAKEQVLAYFESGEFEKAIELMNSSGVRLEINDIHPLIARFENTAAEALLQNAFAEVRRLNHRKESLLAFCNSGFDAGGLIPPVRMPEGYRGKILLVSVSGGVIGQTVCLRTNDLHHRDILRNTELEIRDLGLHGSRVRELGGASVDSESDGSVRIWGGSDDFGTCDKNVAAMLLRSMYPDKTVLVRD